MKEIKGIKLNKCHLCGSEPDVKYSEGGITLTKAEAKKLREILNKLEL